jgi:hypothetical protein
MSWITDHCKELTSRLRIITEREKLCELDEVSEAAAFLSCQGTDIL